jgi:hypothetical protein
MPKNRPDCQNKPLISPNPTTKDELVFILHLLLPIEEEIVPWNTIGCPPIKMGVFWGILAKYARIGGIVDNTLS